MSHDLINDNVDFMRAPQAHTLSGISGALCPTTSLLLQARGAHPHPGPALQSRLHKGERACTKAAGNHAEPFVSTCGLTRSPDNQLQHLMLDCCSCLKEPCTCTFSVSRSNYMALRGVHSQAVRSGT